MKPNLMMTFFAVLLVLILQTSTTTYAHNYTDALSKAILFFEGQRSGRLPASQRMKWRSGSALRDGFSYHRDLTGGYYDAGDNVKFGFPMAFTATMLAWSVIEFRDSMPPAELTNALVATRWVTDYLLKTVKQPDRIYVQVGDPNVDHNCWERPEDMTTARTVYAVNRPNPASDIAGETAAALAAASIAFRSSDAAYSKILLAHAVQTFHFADSHRGAYSDNPQVRVGVCPFYCDSGGYQDELLWAAAWLRRATNEDTYLDYLVRNGQAFGATITMNEFGWENKHAGVNVLVSQELLGRKTAKLSFYRSAAEGSLCTLIPNSPSSDHISYTPGGLMYKRSGSNLQHATALSFLLLAYAKYLRGASQTLTCGSQSIPPESLVRVAKTQVDYILGNNPMKMSYMVGYGMSYPKKIHHRGSTLPSIKNHPQVISCNDGWNYFHSSNPNANELTGAVVGGPGQDDSYTDSRLNSEYSEPTTYINAPLVGVLAYFAAHPSHSGKN